MSTIDINCDVGESYGQYIKGNDGEVFPFITSCNIACGFHGGDPVHIQKTIDLALQYDVQIGAHPSYPDRYGFGRRKMTLPDEELMAVIKYQISALKGMTEAAGGKLKYVKPHGALYNAAAIDESLATLIIRSIQSVDNNLALMGLAGSIMGKVAEDLHVKFVPEAFADRRYTSMGQLANRSLPDAVINSPKQAAEQVLTMVKENNVEALDGNLVEVIAQSFCVHGDNPEAKNILTEIKQTAESAGVEIKAFSL